MICCATKANDDLFEVEFDKKSLRLPLAPCQDNNKILIIYGFDSLYSNDFRNKVDNKVDHHVMKFWWME